MNSIFELFALFVLLLLLMSFSSTGIQISNNKVPQYSSSVSITIIINNNRRLVTLAEHTSDHGRQTNSSTLFIIIIY